MLQDKGAKFLVCGLFLLCLPSVFADEGKRIYSGEDVANYSSLSERLAYLEKVASQKKSGTVRVIVEYSESAIGRQATPGSPVDTKDARRQITSLAGISESVAFSSFPGGVYEVSKGELGRLVNSGLVQSLHYDGFFDPDLDFSVPAIGADVAHGRGYGGSGQAVAILDTGVDSDHPGFEGRVVEEACFSSDSSTSNSLCPDGSDEQHGAGSGVDCDGFIGCRHGTHVAGIAAGVDGVANQADIVSVQVFSERTANCDGGGTCLGVRWSDVISAIDWILYDAETDNIAAVNGSFSSRQNAYSSPCGQSPLSIPITNLRNAGIAPVFSAGNQGEDDVIYEPSCVGSAIAVSSTDSDDEIHSGHSSNALVDLVAPGVGITSADSGGGHVTLTGTSMAAPHVTGAFAVLSAIYPDAFVGPKLEWLKEHGALRMHPTSGIDFVRVDLDSSTSSTNYFPPVHNCQWSLYMRNGGYGWLVEVYQSVGLCQADWKEVHSQYGTVTNTVYW